MEPIRVLNLFTIMNRGGAETMVMNYYRKIDRSKVQFDFLVHREEEGAYEKEILELGGRIYRMPPMYPQNFSLYKKKIREFFEKHKEYKIVHSHMSELGYFALREAKKQGIPVRICHAHSAPHEFDLKMLMRIYFKKRMLPYLTHMFTCGEEAGNYLYGKNNKKKFIQLNNAIEAEQYRYHQNIDIEIRKELGLENRFVIGHVGSLRKPKNHKFLIDIFSQIYQKKKDAVLVLVGIGDLKCTIERQVKELGLEQQVKFLGLREDINRVMQSFDVFVFPSLFEGFPVTMVEAQASGNLCFISDRIPMQCCITDSVRVLSLHDSAERWSEEILSISSEYKKQDRYEEILKAGFDINENAKWLEEFYIEAGRN
ncbi:glycosyltransferase family 1 protein [Anaerostipes faecalis]|uniref:glycosyltransferase family 1 protein n=1 Tax=Anaerostipes faecalis TaxID=2738446 RepID=UPI003F02604B